MILSSVSGISFNSLSLDATATGLVIFGGGLCVFIFHVYVTVMGFMYLIFAAWFFKICYFRSAAVFLTCKTGTVVQFIK